ncbi:hypothetical protein Psfp_02539 [Pelotomaculum sp. FP]|uniref:hypothetical protein n=1 Tax=Pelotomaculum sp. FP TaxID=261474 RepID=UPI001065A3D8|nr:hypothetical protein [Pelotomaculum sp. FP]TEB14967.1 hypothetical protein Psfp_02539 [Pelotomaculum sp. FP]
MSRILNVNMKKFFGAKYERIPRSVLIWGIVFFALRFAEIHINIASSVLALTTLFVTMMSFVVVLRSDDTISSIRGQLMLPEQPLDFHIAFFATIAAHTFLTKTGLLLLVYLTVSEWSGIGVAIFATCFVVSSVVAYALAFRTERKDAVYSRINHNSHNILLYLFRYLWSKKIYLTNTAVLWAFACVLAPVIGKSGFVAAMPLGFAVSCLNTPLGILLSSDKTLYQKVQTLPGQFRTVLFPYAAFMMTANLIACGFYLASWRLTVGIVPIHMIIVAGCFSAIGAFLTVLLELRFPLLNWKVESDLWHHPRKYIVAGILVILALPFVAITG